MDKVRWGVLGTADIARYATIPGMLEADNCVLQAIAGRSLDKAAQFAEEFGFAKAYGSYDELLADPGVEAVYMPLPNDLHREWAIKAMQAGKNVLCEKPLAGTAADVEAMFDAAEQSGVLLMEAFAYLHSPFTTAVRNAITEGRIGKPLSASSTFFYSTPNGANIRMRRATLGGSVYDLGCYNISQLMWFLGEEPDDVRATAQMTEAGVDILTTGLMRFPSGARASFTCGMVLKPEARQGDARFAVFGDAGTIMSQAPFNGDGNLTYTILTPEGEESVTVPARQNYALEVEQFGRCVRGQEKPLLGREFSVRNARVIDQILESIGY